jgi:hypothetical protein
MPRGRPGAAVPAVRSVHFHRRGARYPDAGILRHAAGQDGTPITVVAGLRSWAESRWGDAAKGADLDAMRAIDPDLVEKESEARLGA